jgi:hypothetical protein
VSEQGTPLSTHQQVMQGLAPQAKLAATVHVSIQLAVARLQTALEAA